MSPTRHNAGDSPFDAVIAVGSQGALQAFQVILGCLPAGFPAAIVFDLHRANGLRFTEDLLARHGRLAVRAAGDATALAAGTVYLVPSHRRLLVSETRRMTILDRTDDDRWDRCADALLRSAAAAYGSRLIAVVLSGRLAAGADGVREVKAQGGRVLVQDPQTAPAPSMPNNALATGCVDFALAPDRLGHALVALCSCTGAADLFKVRLNTAVRG